MSPLQPCLCIQYEPGTQLVPHQHSSEAKILPKTARKIKLEFLATSSETGLDFGLGSLTSHSKQPWPLISQYADEGPYASGQGLRIPREEVSGLPRSSLQAQTGGHTLSNYFSLWQLQVEFRKFRAGLVWL